jgi:hypothetical protein
MAEGSDPREALGRAGRRAAYHLLQAVIEGLKAVEAVIEEVGSINRSDDSAGDGVERTRIEVE